MRRIFRYAAVATLVAAVLGVPAWGANADTGGKLDRALESALARKGSADFWLLFEAEADLRAASKKSGWKARGDAVVNALRHTADTSQAGVRRTLRSTGADYQTYYVANAILVRGGDQALARRLAADPAVAQVLPRRTYQLHMPTVSAQEPGIQVTEWGVNAIRAPLVWSTFGTRGEGIVVGSIDTGVDFDHPALVNHYRGNLGGGSFDHNYNWYDPSSVCGSPSLVPCDNNNHGSHTIGTMVGDDGGSNQIGVAPGAKFISAKGCESSSCSDAALLSSGQWMLAPTDLTGSNPRADLRPNIVNNSWGSSNGSAVDPFYRATVQAWRASGIFPAFSNGNSGPGCNTTGSPADYTESFGTGAFDINGAIASFSSRGPGENGTLRPNISAPGVAIRSAINGGGYASFNGTSMASPHTVGAIALLWSAAPSLLGDIAQTEALLDQTAVDVSDLTCGGSVDDNNVWGEGKLDAYALVDQAPRGPVGTLTGVVTDAGTGNPIAGASVQITGPVNRNTSTGADGRYTRTLPVGDYHIAVSASGYVPDSADVTVTEGTTTTRDFALAEVNQPPVANDDSYTTDEDTSLTVAAPGVLGNDTDGNGDALAAALGSGPSHGTLTLNADGSFTYTPDANYAGADSFTYTASDGTSTDGATVQLTVNAVNDPPVAADDAYTTEEDSPLLVAAPGVLGNDTDVEGDALTAELVTGPSHGSLVFHASGAIMYSPDTNYSGPDSFTYRASDGAAVSNVATVSLTVTSADDPPVVVVAAGGSCGEDGHSGTVNLALSDPDTPASSLTLSVTSSRPALLPAGNVSFGGSGASRTLTASTVAGVTGTAVLTVTVSDGTSSATVTITVRVGGNGNDTVNGTAGADMLFGQNGNDTLNGLAGNDLLCGGNGNDRINGGDGDDTMAGALGADRFTGGAGADGFHGGPGTDTATDYTPAQGDTRTDIP